MKEIRKFKLGDQIPSTAKYLSTEDHEEFFFEVPIKEKSESVISKDLVEEVIQYLNDKTGKKFKPIGSNAKLIRDRVKIDKATFEDFKKAIDNMVAEWEDNPKMKGYLRPSTLFQASKFDGYVNHKPKSEEVSDAFKDLEGYC